MFASAPSEWYSWVVDLRTKSNIKVLLWVDASSFPLGTDPNQSWYGATQNKVYVSALKWLGGATR